MLDAANAWLDSLTEDQRAAAVLPWPSAEERHRWFYTPTDHGGLPLNQQRPAQQRLAMRLLASGLSQPGYVTVSTIMGMENVLDQLEGWQTDWDRERGRDPQLYWLRVFGQPNSAGPWSWRFGGHHVSVQHLIVDGEVRASTPCFLGSDPAAAPLLGGHLLRPLGAAEDLARDLVRSLADEQAGLALISPVPPVDIVSGNRPRVREGDIALPLGDVWRGRFADVRLQELLDEVQSGAEQKVGLRPEHHAALRLTDVPKGVAAAKLSPSQQDQLRQVLHLSLTAFRTNWPNGRRRSSPATDCSTCTSPGQAVSNAASRTTTGCRVRACWPNTTTPSTMSTTCTRCGATPAMTSAMTCWPSTWQCSIRKCDTRFRSTDHPPLVVRSPALERRVLVGFGPASHR